MSKPKRRNVEAAIPAATKSPVLVASSSLKRTSSVSSSIDVDAAEPSSTQQSLPESAKPGQRTSKREISVWYNYFSKGISSCCAIFVTNH